MQEMSVPISKFLAYSLWGLTALLILMAWVTYQQSHDLAIMLATTACITGLGATTSSVRCYSVRLAKLIRMAGGLAHDKRIHSVANE